MKPSPNFLFFFRLFIDVLVVVVLIFLIGFLYHATMLIVTYGQILAWLKG